MILVLPSRHNLDVILALAGALASFLPLSQGIAVICYHDLQVRPHNEMTNTPANFEAHLKWLQSHGYATLSMDELTAVMQRKLAAPPKAVVLTFDDGYQGVYRFAYPLLRRYGFKAVLFLVTRKVGDLSGEMAHLTWRQIGEMDRAGVVDAEVHAGIMHIKMAVRERAERAAGKKPTDIEEDLRAAKTDVESHLRKRVRYLAWPYGSYNAGLIAMAQRLGYVALVTTDYGLNGPGGSILRIKRIRMSTANDTLKRFEFKMKQYGLQ